MTDQPAWQWDESVQVGVDYGSLDEVRAYDERMASIRDVLRENGQIVEAVGLRPGQSVIDLGTGTGAFARHAAAICSRVYACDVSSVMLQYARQKAEEAGRTNIKFCHGGFLTYRHAGPPVDAVISQLALHHLPDFWKQVALRRVAGMLRTGGRFYLRDVVFPAAAAEDAGYFDAVLAAAPPTIQQEMAQHIRQEYSTLDWIMEGLLEHAGLAIDQRQVADPVIVVYLCTKR